MAWRSPFRKPAAPHCRAIKISTCEAGSKQTKLPENIPGRKTMPSPSISDFRIDGDRVRWLDCAMRFQPVEWHETLDSTSAALRERAERGAAKAGAVVAAREQTAGRGRQGRPWVSVPGRDLAFSFLVESRAPAERVLALPMAVALAVAEALTTLRGAARVKWPNDVRVGGRKIAGILAERSDRQDGAAWLIVGVGVNVNMEEAAAARIGAPATSVRMETGQETPVEAALAAILAALPPQLDRWEQGGFEALRAEWEARSEIRVGDRLCAGHDRSAREGILAGYGPCGEMLLRREGGTVEAAWTGELDLEPRTLSSGP
jgi:BirA family transcriptional regulator, biotin operon repressor / biotin---[acetyl-CoA-carboxylase] ligase